MNIFRVIFIVFVFATFLLSLKAQPQPFALYDWDAVVYQQLPDVMTATASTNISKRDDGLIGRNAKWGQMYSARFQLGSGDALRVALQANEHDQIRAAFDTVMAGTRTIQSDGSLLSDVPPELKPSPDMLVPLPDQVSGAAFFLGDACEGIIALQNTPVIPQQEVDDARQQLALGVAWLAMHSNILMNIDQHAPNRLLFDARSYQACSWLTNDSEKYQELSKKFVEAALDLLESDGYFLEGGGWDTNYQAVAIRLGNDILGMGYIDSEHRLSDGLNLAADWLLARIDAEGHVNSDGNTRTCWGQETFLNEPKSLSLTDVVFGLAYRSAATNDNRYLEGAQRVVSWWKDNLQGDPCYRAAR